VYWYADLPALSLVENLLDWVFAQMFVQPIEHFDWEKVQQAFGTLLQ
jgi:hypothetical protein